MFSSMKIRSKIMSAFFVITVLTILLGIFSLLQIGRVYDKSEDIAKNLLPSVVNLAVVDSQLNLNRRGELQVCNKTTSEEYQRYVKRLTETAEKAGQALAVLEKLPLTTDEKKMFGDLKDLVAVYYKDAAKTYEIAKGGDLEETTRYMRSVSKKSYDAAQKSINGLIEYNQKESVDAVKESDALYSSARYWIIGTIIVCVAAAIVLGLLLAGIISAPIRKLADESNRIASGDLRVNLKQTGSDEIGEMTGSFVAMVDNLRSMIGKIEAASNRVTNTSGEVYSTSEQMATGAEEVASQAATVATAGEEMSATSGDIAQNCQMAAESANRANESAESGSQVVQDTVKCMYKIAERVNETSKTVASLGARSDQIGQIVGTIEDIADQTNLLALNAAIEAARAGEQGRGFAVVADEVRALAERTTRATREIGEMIKAIQAETRGAVTAMEQGVKEVESGTVEAAKSGEAISDIINQIGSLQTQVNQIATAAEEQTATTSEISSNMIQITEVVQQTARGAHESAAAANQLKIIAEELQGLVSQFRL
ncbi:MAG: HAMP domain-containing methyl-accepting chemotaxis protein [Geobacteraceae bacterium]|nr:HAMP domain-containing methyl-accepting chemotaxis protein [Geobacteraceae bacterium]